MHCIATFATILAFATILVSLRSRILAPIVGLTPYRQEQEQQQHSDPTGGRRRVFVYQAEGGPPCPLSWMYRPITQTLKALFSSKRVPSLSLKVRNDTRPFVMLNDKNNYPVQSSTPSMDQNDVLVFVGNRGMEWLPWKSFRENKNRPYLVYYNTEHVQYQKDAAAVPLPAQLKNFAEIWDYSRANILYMQQNRNALSIKRGTVLRFVPPMVVAEDESAEEDPLHAAAPGPPGGKTKSCAAPTFLGKTKWRKQCWPEFVKHFDYNVTVVSDACSPSSWRTIMQTTDVVLNVHKRCGRHANYGGTRTKGDKMLEFQPCEAVRFQQIFGSSRLDNEPPPLIISQRCHAEDEAHWCPHPGGENCMVDFVDTFGEMRAKFDEFCAMGEAERRKVRAGRASLFRVVGGKVTRAEFQKFFEEKLSGA